MDWLRDTQWLWWVGAAVALGLVEVATLDLTFAMLTVAALAAAGAAYAGGSFTVQVLVFAAMSALLLAVVRPLALRKLKPAGPGERTNTAAHVGRRADVLARVTDRTGRVKLAGEEWSARSARAGVVFEVDDVVRVTAIDGATAVVEAATPAGPSDPNDPREPP